MPLNFCLGAFMWLAALGFMMFGHLIHSIALFIFGFIFLDLQRVSDRGEVKAKKLIDKYSRK